MKMLIRGPERDYGVIGLVGATGALTLSGDVPFLRGVVADNRRQWIGGQWRRLSNRQLVERLPERMRGHVWAEVVSDASTPRR